MNCDHAAALSWEGVEWCHACGSIRVVDAQDIPPDVWVPPERALAPGSRYAGLCNKAHLTRTRTGSIESLSHCNKPHGHEGPCR